MELREKIARQVCPLSDKPNECKFCYEYKGCPDSWSDVTKTTDQIIKLFQEHYAELAEKSGLKLTPEEISEAINTTKSVPSLHPVIIGAKAQLARVMVWHEAEVAAAVKAERESIFKILETFTDSQDYLKSLRVMIIHNPDFHVRPEGK